MSTAYLNRHQEKLELYTTAITRAHGAHHPEVFEVKKLYTVIQAKINAAGSELVDLEPEFAALRKLTNNYEVPGDVCETFAAVYHMLAKADAAYQQENVS